MTDREVMKQAFDALQWARNQLVLVGRLCEVAPDTKEVSNAIEALRAALAEPECKCDLRTRLVGDGCSVCNPELAAELIGGNDE